MGEKKIISDFSCLILTITIFTLANIERFLQKSSFPMRFFLFEPLLILEFLIFAIYDYP
jgi:hypothetical protein